MWKILNASPLEVNFLAVGEGYWEVGDGYDSEWKYSFFFFFPCWSGILLLLLYNRYRNLNLKPFQPKLILSLLVVSDAVADNAAALP